MVSKQVFLGKMARVEGKLDVVLKEIKALLCGIAIQNNEMMRLMINKKGGVNRGSILGNPVEVLDDMNELKELKQTGSLRDYFKAFEVLLDKAQLNEEQALRCFLAGLEHELKMMVTMFNPKTLKEAYSLAKLQDAVKSDLARHGQGKGFFNKNQDSSASLQVQKNNLSLSNSVNMGVKIMENNLAFVKNPLNLTPKQREEKRLKNQCC